MKTPALLIGVCLALFIGQDGSAQEPPRFEGIKTGVNRPPPSHSWIGVIHVPGDYATIQRAIDAARDGNVILVAPGTYGESISFKGKAITVRSDVDGHPQTIDTSPETTVIDAGRMSCAVHFESAWEKEAALMGFTVRNGSDCGIFADETIPFIENNLVRANHGDGIVGFESLMTIRNNKVWDNQGSGIYIFVDTETWFRESFIENNSIVGNGGAGLHLGIYSTWKEISVVKNNLIIGNQGNGIELGRDDEKYETLVIRNTIAGNGSAGIDAEHDYLKMQFIDQCLIVGNRYGGVKARMFTDMTLKNSVIAGNVGEDGGGIWMDEQASVYCANCTIMKNRANVSGGGIHNETSDVVLRNCIVWNNHSPQGPQIHSGSGASTVVTYCDVKGGWTGKGNIDAVPDFDATPPLGYWTGDAVYDEASHSITFQDDTADWALNRWAGALINPDTTQRIHLIIIGNTKNSITAWADWPTIESGVPWVPADSQYHISGYHLTRKSPCIDAGTGDGASLHDIDGDDRPQFHGFDIGADEYHGVLPYGKLPARSLPPR